eukprot:CAMPEP_0172191278 /NCGR_PEP_ID=MMETSP1050-20130122/23610_1 /TAXON_ID=233186 /ORGANISM="Cryptomonas curvata, Strain CCAP979/52" /LENGTH=99 /DNA_ID=CAMNT_0012866305 /DNA_START=132 /DNA_END=431 /DNA_ORIENTATION=-
MSEQSLCALQRRLMKDADNHDRLVQHWNSELSSSGTPVSLDDKPAAGVLNRRRSLTAAEARDRRFWGRKWSWRMEVPRVHLSVEADRCRIGIAMHVRVT